MNWIDFIFLIIVVIGVGFGIMWAIGGMIGIKIEKIRKENLKK